LGRVPINIVGTSPTRIPVGVLIPERGARSAVGNRCPIGSQRRSRVRKTADLQNKSALRLLLKLKGQAPGQGTCGKSPESGDVHDKTGS